MTGLTETTPLTLGVRRSVQRRWSSGAGMNTAATDRLSCAVLYVTYPGAALLLSMGSQRFTSSCCPSLARASRTARHKPTPQQKLFGRARKYPQHFDQLMESNHV